MIAMDDISSLLALADRMLWITALVAAPVLLASLAIGLVVGIIQAATSVNEQTLTFVPKLAVTALVLVLFGSAMLGLIGDFTKEIFEQIAMIGK
jgi:flagellar biosynthetic protein FliQ